MSYPAYESFAVDPDVTYGRWRVYMSLRPPFLSHATACDVKIEVVRRNARVSTRTTVAVMRWLIERGYVVLHGRDARGTASLSLAWALPEASSNGARFPSCTHSRSVPNGVAHTQGQ